MSAESRKEPIPRQAILDARARLVAADTTIESWAERNGFNPKTVYGVLSLTQRKPAIRGIRLQIAVALGLRTDPAAAQVTLHSPAGRTVAGGPPIAEGNRGALLSMGEMVR